MFKDWATFDFSSCLHQNKYRLAIYYFAWVCPLWTFSIGSPLLRLWKAIPIGVRHFCGLRWSAVATFLSEICFWLILEKPSLKRIEKLKTFPTPSRLPIGFFAFSSIFPNPRTQPDPTMWIYAFRLLTSLLRFGILHFRYQSGSHLGFKYRRGAWHALRPWETISLRIGEFHWALATSAGLFLLHCQLLFTLTKKAYSFLKEQFRLLIIL